MASESEDEDFLKTIPGKLAEKHRNLRASQSVSNLPASQSVSNLPASWSKNWKKEHSLHVSSAQNMEDKKQIEDKDSSDKKCITIKPPSYCRADDLAFDTRNSRPSTEFSSEVKHNCKKEIIVNADEETKSPKLLSESESEKPFMICLLGDKRKPHLTVSDSELHEVVNIAHLPEDMNTADKVISDQAEGLSRVDHERRISNIDTSESDVGCIETVSEPDEDSYEDQTLSQNLKNNIDIKALMAHAAYVHIPTIWTKRTVVGDSSSNSKLKNKGNKQNENNIGTIQFDESKLYEGVMSPTLISDSEKEEDLPLILPPKRRNQHLNKEFQTKLSSLDCSKKCVKSQHDIQKKLGIGSTTKQSILESSSTEADIESLSSEAENDSCFLRSVVSHSKRTSLLKPPVQLLHKFSANQCGSLQATDISMGIVSSCTNCVLTSDGKDREIIDNLSKDQVSEIEKNKLDPCSFQSLPEETVVYSPLPAFVKENKLKPVVNGTEMASVANNMQNVPSLVSTNNQSATGLKSNIKALDVHVKCDDSDSIQCAGKKNTQEPPILKQLSSISSVLNRCESDELLSPPLLSTFSSEMVPNLSNTFEQMQDSRFLSNLKNLNDSAVLSEKQKQQNCIDAVVAKETRDGDAQQEETTVVDKEARGEDAQQSLLLLEEVMKSEIYINNNILENDKSALRQKLKKMHQSESQIMEHKPGTVFDTAKNHDLVLTNKVDHSIDVSKTEIISSNNEDTDLSQKTTDSEIYCRNSVQENNYTPDDDAIMVFESDDEEMFTNLTQVQVKKEESFEWDESQDKYVDNDEACDRLLEDWDDISSNNADTNDNDIKQMDDNVLTVSDDDNDDNSFLHETSSHTEKDTPPLTNKINPLYMVPTLIDSTPIAVDDIEEDPYTCNALVDEERFEGKVDATISRKECLFTDNNFDQLGNEIDSDNIYFQPTQTNKGNDEDEFEDGMDSTLYLAATQVDHPTVAVDKYPQLSKEDKPLTKKCLELPEKTTNLIAESINKGISGGIQNASKSEAKMNELKDKDMDKKCTPSPYFSTVNAYPRSEENLNFRKANLNIDWLKNLRLSSSKPDSRVNKKEVSGFAKNSSENKQEIARDVNKKNETLSHLSVEGDISQFDKNLSEKRRTRFSDNASLFPSETCDRIPVCSFSKANNLPAALSNVQDHKTERKSSLNRSERGNTLHVFDAPTIAFELDKVSDDDPYLVATQIDTNDNNISPENALLESQVKKNTSINKDVNVLKESESEGFHSKQSDLVSCTSKNSMQDARIKFARIKKTMHVPKTKEISPQPLARRRRERKGSHHNSVSPALLSSPKEIYDGICTHNKAFTPSSGSFTDSTWLSKKPIEAEIILANNKPKEKRKPNRRKSKTELDLPASEARKQMEDRRKQAMINPSGISKSWRQKVVHVKEQNDIEDVEMPSTQQVMEMGLPLLTKVKPVLKKRKLLNTENGSGPAIDESTENTANKNQRSLITEKSSEEHLGSKAVLNRFVESKHIKRHLTDNNTENAHKRQRLHLDQNVTLGTDNINNYSQKCGSSVSMIKFDCQKHSVTDCKNNGSADINLNHSSYGELSIKKSGIEGKDNRRSASTDNKNHRSTGTSYKDHRRSTTNKDRRRHSANDSLKISERSSKEFLLPHHPSSASSSGLTIVDQANHRYSHSVSALDKKPEVDVSNSKLVHFQSRADEKNIVKIKADNLFVKKRQADATAIVHEPGGSNTNKWKNHHGTSQTLPIHGNSNIYKHKESENVRVTELKTGLMTPHQMRHPIDKLSGISTPGILKDSRKNTRISYKVENSRRVQFQEQSSSCSAITGQQKNIVHKLQYHQQMQRHDLENPMFSKKDTCQPISIVQKGKCLLHREQLLYSVLHWSPNWLQEHEKFAGKQNILPPIIKEGELFPLVTTYESITDYQQMYFNLLLVETWEELFCSWKEKKNHFQYCQVLLTESGRFTQTKTPLIRFCWKGLLTLKQCQMRQHPLKEDIVIVEMQGQKLPNSTAAPPVSIETIKQLAFVEKVSVQKCTDKQYLLHKFPALGADDSSKLQEVYVMDLTLLFFYRKFAPNNQILATISSIGSITTAVRRFSALFHFPQNRYLLRDILKPTAVVFSHSISQALPVKSGIKYNEVQSQVIDSVAAMVQEPPTAPHIFLLQGPPGTGKSYTIIELITKILQENTKTKICLAAPSNAAVDELLRRLIQRKKLNASLTFSVVRIGKPINPQDDVKAYLWNTLAEKAKRDEIVKKRLANVPSSVQQELEHLKKKIGKKKDEMKQFIIQRKENEKLKCERGLTDLKKRLLTIENSIYRGQKDVTLTASDIDQIYKDVLLNANIVCGTLSSFGHWHTYKVLHLDSETSRSHNHFSCVIIDEATQATELDCLIPLQLGMSKLVLVGDPNQLPPTVRSAKAQSLNYGLSLFERLYNYFQDERKSPVIMLCRQYRMDPRICRFPNSYIYQDLLSTDRQVLDKCKQFPLQPYIVFNIHDGQESLSQSGSVCNEVEAECTALLVQQLLSFGFDLQPSSIGIICPYSSQKRLLTNMLHKKRLGNVEVNTVDGFQGREKKIIILSCVRARSSSGSIGFLSDKRRMNVALTRAKYSLYIIGHLESLKTDEHWAALVENAEQQKPNVVLHVSSLETFPELIKQHCVKSEFYPVRTD